MKAIVQSNKSIYVLKLLIKSTGLKSLDRTGPAAEAAACGSSRVAAHSGAVLGHIVFHLVRDTYLVKGTMKLAKRFYEI